MNNLEFITSFMNIYNPKCPANTLQELTSREIVVSINHANHGRPSTALIEISGSPPKFMILIDLTNEYESLFIIKGKAAPKNYEKRNELRKIIINYLKSNNYLK